MRQNESFSIRLKALLSRLDDMQGNYSSDEDKALSDLDEIKEELEEINEQLFHFEDYLYTSDHQNIRYGTLQSNHKTSPS